MKNTAAVMLLLTAVLSAVAQNVDEKKLDLILTYFYSLQEPKYKALADRAKPCMIENLAKLDSRIFSAVYEFFSKYHECKVEADKEKEDIKKLGTFLDCLDMKAGVSYDYRAKVDRVINGCVVALS